MSLRSVRNRWAWWCLTSRSAWGSTPRRPPPPSTRCRRGARSWGSSRSTTCTWRLRWRSSRPVLPVSADLFTLSIYLSFVCIVCDRASMHVADRRHHLLTWRHSKRNCSECGKCQCRLSQHIVHSAYFWCSLGNYLTRYMIARRKIEGLEIFPAAILLQPSIKS